MTSSTLSPSGRSTLHYGYVIVACCCLMMGINVGLTFSCAGIFYEPVSASIGVPVGEFGIYMSVMYVTSTLMLPAAGRMLERMSARRLFTAMSAIMGLSFAGMALADKVWQFYIAGGVLGVTLAFLLYMSFPTLVNRWFRTRVGVMIGICSAASGIGGMVFNPIAGWLITAFGWRWAYGAFAFLLLAVVTPLLGLLLRDYPSDKGLTPFGSEPASSMEGTAVSRPGNVKEESGIEYHRALRMPVFYGLILFAFIMMGVSTLNLFIPGYVSSSGFSMEQASLAAAVAMAGVTVGKLVLGYINDRDCITGVAVTTLTGIAGLVVLVAGGGSLWMLLGGAFLFGWEYAGVTVQTAMLTKTVFGLRHYAAIYSNISIALACGGAIASGGWGLLADASGFHTIFWCGAAALAIALLMGLWGVRSTRPSR